MLSEADNILRRDVGEGLEEVRRTLATNLDRGQVGVATDPSQAMVSQCVSLTKYLPDARVLAAAIETDCEVLVSEDKQHLLHNPEIGLPNTKLVVMNTREALDWLQGRIISDIRGNRQRQT